MSPLIIYYLYSVELSVVSTLLEMEWKFNIEIEHFGIGVGEWLT